MSKLDDEKLNYIKSVLEEIDFGSILITIHNGEITQIDATEKKRFSKNNEKK